MNPGAQDERQREGLNAKLGPHLSPRKALCPLVLRLSPAQWEGQRLWGGAGVVVRKKAASPEQGMPAHPRAPEPQHTSAKPTGEG